MKKLTHEAQSIRERIIRPKSKPKPKTIEKVKPNELALLIGLTNEKDKSKQGWMFCNEILEEKGTDGKLLFKSQSNHFSTYIKPLVNIGLVEERIKYPYEDKKGNIRKKNRYRIVRNDAVRCNIFKLIVDSKKLGYDPRVFERDYFKTVFKIDKKLYDQALNEQIKELERKLRFFKFLKKR